MRIRHTLIPLCIKTIALAKKTRGREIAKDPGQMSSKKVFQFLLETISALTSDFPDMSLRLYLLAAQAANDCGFDPIAYECVTQAFVIYEDEISDSKAQFNAIALIVGSLHGMSKLSSENYDTLTVKTVQYSAKLLKKPDQCRAVSLCSHLFWAGREGSEGLRNGQRVLECLQKSLKIADACVDTQAQLQLFVEILNEYLFFFKNNVEQVTADYISLLISLIETKFSGMETTSSDDIAFTYSYYKNTLAHLHERAHAADGEGYRAIKFQKK